jgi:predicted dehydrogenase
MANFGVGIVGCGHTGGNHANVWRSIDEATIIGVCDIDVVT